MSAKKGSNIPLRSDNTNLLIQLQNWIQLTSVASTLPLDSTEVNTIFKYFIITTTDNSNDYLELRGK